MQIETRSFPNSLAATLATLPSMSPVPPAPFFVEPQILLALEGALQILPSVSIVSAALVIAALGAIGGLVNCAIAGEFALPHIDREAKVWRPGWIGNVVVGAVAAPVIWGIYGPLAGHAITGADKIDLTLAQVFVSVVIGLGGGRILTLEAQKQAERVAKNNITKLVEESIVESEDQK
jgi:hypothetical protein